jgi:carbon monoxide dehydrogenase subunit G
MARAYASTVCNADVETVWALVRNFEAVGRWIPGAKSCRILPTGDSAAPVRRIVLGDDSTIDEVLVTLDDIRRRLRYVFVPPLPRGMRSFLGTAHVRPVTDGARTFVEWISEFDCDAGWENQMVSNISGQLTQILAAVTAEVEATGECHDVV